MVERSTLSEMVQNAMGQSVTPSRLKESKTPGFFDRLLGSTEIPGPFYSDVRPTESIHYLFRNGTEISIPEEQDPNSDDHIEIAGQSHMVSVVVITDRRSLFFYSAENERNKISLNHSDLIEIKFNDGILLNKMSLSTTQHAVETTVSLASSYSSELSDAVAYIADEAGIDEEATGFDFEDSDIDSAKDALMNQLSNIDGIRDQINISEVADEAASGAKFGIKRGKITGVLGLTVFGGIEIWNQLSESNNDISIEDLDPHTTAEDIAKWQKMGKSSDYRGMELASGAVGAAISVDKQTSGREVSRMLSELDIDWVNRQLEDGTRKDAAIRVASEAVEAYSTEISWLSEQYESDENTSS